MNKTVLYPFRIDTDFQIAYAWSAELSRRLKTKLSLFTTLASTSAEPVADVYKALAEAQGFYVKHFQLLPFGLRPVKTGRHFLEGEFASRFLAFSLENPPHLMVLQSDLFSNDLMKDIIHSGCKVIVLPPNEKLKTPLLQKDRMHLFVAILQQAALYNIPSSFFSTISQDTGLFNAIAAFFKK